MGGNATTFPLGTVPVSPDINDGTLARTQSPFAGPIGLDAGRPTPARGGSSAAPIGTQVVQYAQARAARRVGDGECFALADGALRNAGAKSAADFGSVTEDADYVWGAAVSLADVQPGDIIQFRDYEVTRREEKQDGSWQERTEKRPHHTAIVISNQGHGMLRVIEQNSPQGSAVREIQLGFETTTFQSGSTSVRITVSGRLWFYRPQAR